MSLNPLLRSLPAAAALHFSFLFALLGAMPAAAQTTYKWIDPATGRTVISDQAPPPGVKPLAKQVARDEGGDQPLPYAVRQVVDKFPVTIYTSANCGDVCKHARDLLNGRGVPFAEKMLQTPEEFAEATQLLGSDTLIPSVTVGREKYKGFNADSWNNLLNLAGYPKTAAYGQKPSGAFAR